MIKKKDQIILIIYTVVITLLIIICAYLLTSLYINNNLTRTIQDHNLIIEYNPKIKTDLLPLKDIDGLGTKGYKVNVTNLNSTNVEYEILLGNINSNEENIRLSFDDMLIRNLNKFTKEDNNYVIYKAIVDAGYTDIHYIKMWLLPGEDKLPVNFKINVKIIS